MDGPATRFANMYRPSRMLLTQQKSSTSRVGRWTARRRGSRTCTGPAGCCSPSRSPALHEWADGRPGDEVREHVQAQQDVAHPAEVQHFTSGPMDGPATRFANMYRPSRMLLTQ